MPDWIAKLLQEWPLVAAVPIPFAIAFVGIAAAISLAVGWFYRGVHSKRADRRLLIAIVSMTSNAAGATHDWLLEDVLSVGLTNGIGFA